MSCVCHAFTSVHCYLWSPAGKGLTSWLLFLMFNCVFLTFPCGILGQVFFLIVSLPDLCHLSYFYCYCTMDSLIVIVSIRMGNPSEYKGLVNALFINDKDSLHQIMGGLMSRGYFT